MPSTVWPRWPRCHALSAQTKDVVFVRPSISTLYHQTYSIYFDPTVSVEDPPSIFLSQIPFGPYFSGVGRVAQSVYRMTTGWTVRDRNPVETRFSARPDRPWGPPSLLYNGYRVFPGGKVRPGCAADHSPPSSAAVMEK